MNCQDPAFWLMSQEFLEAESPGGFAALEGSARFQGLRTPRVQRVPLPVRFAGPAHRGAVPSNRVDQVWSFGPLTEGTVPKNGLYCLGIPVVDAAHRGYVALAGLSTSTRSSLLPFSFNEYTLALSEFGLEALFTGWRRSGQAFPVFWDG